MTPPTAGACHEGKMGRKTQRGTAKEGNREENRPERRGPPETRRSHEAALGREAHGILGKDKSCLK
jgi:hypothetical protein